MQKKGSSIGWNHQQADPEFGAMQARELQYHLQGVLTAFPINVRVGKGYVECCPKGINKGVMAEKAIDIASSSDARDAHGNPVRLAPPRPKPPRPHLGLTSASPRLHLGLTSARATS